MQSDAVQGREELWVRVELSAGGGGQALFVAVGVHSEAAVAAAPVVAVGGKTDGETRNFVQFNMFLLDSVNVHLCLMFHVNLTPTCDMTYSLHAVM